TAIALLYFLKTLEDRRFDRANGIVVIDDPVSSLDAGALFNAFSFIVERATKVGQFFLLTHSFPLLRQVKEWTGHVDAAEKKACSIEKRNAEYCRYYLVRPEAGPGGRNGTVREFDPMLKDHDSEYQFLFKCIYREVFARQSERDGLEGLYS